MLGNGVEDFNFGTLVGSNEVSHLSKFNRRTDHGCEDRVDVPRSRVSALLNPLCKVSFVTGHP